MGRSALANATTGGDNTAIGGLALGANQTGTGNVAVGLSALRNATGGCNVGIGRSAGCRVTSGVCNTVIGSLAVSNGTGATGNVNTFVGMCSGFDLSSGTQNVALGFRAGANISSGDNNTFLGYEAGNNASIADNGTMVGRCAGRETSGGNNTFIGNNSGYLVTTGGNNTILGRYSGNQCGLDIRTSSNYIVLSDGAGCPRLYYTGQWCIPDNKKLSLTTSTGTTGGVRIQNTSNNTNANAIEFYGWNNTKTGSISTFVNTTTYSTSSDYRLKENVTCINNAINVVTQLNPVAFSWVHQASDTPTINGFLAHEVQALIPEAVIGEKDAMTVDDDGNEVPDYQGIDQSKLVPILTAALKEAITRIETLEAKVTALENT
jgi:hypothetical protein